MLAHRESAVLDAEILLAFSIGCEREYLISHSEEEIDDAISQLYLAYLKQVN